MALGIAPRARRRGSLRAPMAEINVTPLVDVMLVLLIIFMVTAPLLTSAVPVDLPDSRAQPLESPQEAVTISIDRDGRIFIDDSEVAEDDLEEALATIDRGGSDAARVRVVLRADRRLDYGRVMAVMGRLNRAGFDSIALVTSGSENGP